MMKKIFIYLLITFVSLPAQAAVFRFESSSNPVGQNQLVMISITLDGEGQKINAVAGSLIFNPIGAEVVQVYDGNTVVTNWLERPKVGSCLIKCEIVFSGIIAGGFSGLLSPYYSGIRPGKLFSVLVRVKTVGQIKFDVNSTEAYLNDGEGTPVPVKVETLILNSVSSEPLAGAPDILDKAVPEPFSILLSRDQSIYGNKYFVVFNPHDKDSGISYTEIKEGERGFVRANSPYVLENQSLGEEITVKAVDYFGNETFSKIHPAPNNTASNNNLIWVIVLILFGLSVVVRVYETKYKK
jgi:hypothetical protein